MKKILRFLITCLIVSNSSLVIVACRPSSLGEIWIITDGGDLFDKAFNQQVIEGSKDFASTFNKNRALISNISGFEYWKNHSIRIKWIISKDAELSTLQTNYNIAHYAGAKTIICAGFNHIPALTVKLQKTYAQLGIRFVLIDSLINNPINVAGLTYSSEQSGYFSGLAAAIWLVANHEKYGDKLKMSSFGGLAADSIVQSMSGYYWGIYYFNQFRNSDPDILMMINKIRVSQNKPEMTDDELSNNNYKIIFDKLANSFTGSFESGTPNAKSITSQLIDKNKNNIVFAVAGGQTTDLINTIVNSQHNKSAKIIGVDVDQSKQYDHAKDYFITSALKGIRASVEWILWHSFNLKRDDNSQEISYDPEGEKYFNGENKYSPLKGKGYTGISDNPAISEIYQLLINDTNKYWDLSNKVLAAFKKLNDYLATVNDSKKWDNAWKNYINEKNPNYRPEFE